MARQRFSGNLPNRNTAVVLRDLNQRPILTVSERQFSVRDGHGNTTYHNISESIQLACGTIWDTSFLTNRPPIYLGICNFCREPRFSLFRRNHRSHGIIALHRGKLCVCGVLVCPSHRRRGRDGKWRCLSCARKDRLKNIIRPLFFERKED